MRSCNPSKLLMAGQDFVKSSPRSILGSNKAPKPKQASILSFFNSSQKSSSQVTASPLSQASAIAAGSENDSSFLADSSTVMEEEFSPVDEGEFLEAATFTSNESIKKAKVDIDFSYLIKSSNEKGIVAPRVLSELNQLTGNLDLEQVDPASAGRYPWLVDLRDAQGRRKGIVKSYIT